MIMKSNKIGAAALILAMTIAAAGLTGCAEDDKTGSLDTVDPTKYVTLGEYKGLSIAAEDTSVTDEDVENSIKSMLAEYGEMKEVTGRSARLGDTVNIDYEGIKDGVAFQGGTGTKDLELGSHTFIDGFEDGVVGMSAGDKKDLDLTFPEEYHDADLAGADVIFHVQVNSISENVIPELTDEFVKGLDGGYQTVEEYRGSVRNQLAEQKETQAKDSMEAELMQMAIDNAQCDLQKLPEWLVTQNKVSYTTGIESFVSQYGMTLDEYLSSTGGDIKSFEAEAEDYARDKSKNDLVVEAIAKAEGLEVSEEERNEYFSEYASTYGTTIDEIKKALSEDELNIFLLQTKVMDFLYENANIEASKSDQ